MFARSSALTWKISQRPHSDKRVQKLVRFEDHIDVFLGDDDDIHMTCFHVTQATIRNWSQKPWSRHRIKKSDLCPAPLSIAAVSSRLDDAHSAAAFEGIGSLDDLSLMQIAQCKNDIYSGQESQRIETFSNPAGIPNELQNNQQETESGGHRNEDSGTELSLSIQFRNPTALTRWESARSHSLSSAGRPNSHLFGVDWLWSYDSGNWVSLLCQPGICCRCVWSKHTTSRDFRWCCSHYCASFSWYCRWTSCQISTHWFGIAWTQGWITFSCGTSHKKICDGGAWMVWSKFSPYACECRPLLPPGRGSVFSLAWQLPMAWLWFDTSAHCAWWLYSYCNSTHRKVWLSPLFRWYSGLKQVYRTKRFLTMQPTMKLCLDTHLVCFRKIAVQALAVPIAESDDSDVMHAMQTHVDHVSLTLSLAHRVTGVRTSKVGTLICSELLSLLFKNVVRWKNLNFQFLTWFHWLQ